VELSDFLATLKDVGSRPYAFAAYIAVVSAWVYTTVARYRLGKIAKLLKDLPPQHRARVIEKEYSTLPSSGLSAEQWIKSRRHVLLFIAFLSLLLCLTIIVIIALDSGPEKGALNETILKLERELKVQKAELDDIKISIALANAANSRAVERMQELQRQLPSTDPVTEMILSDPTVGLKKLDDDIADQSRRIQVLASVQSDEAVIDVETMKLKRLIDKRSQTFDILRQIIAKYNETAKGIIDSMH
jgi:hypothetical protein